MFWDLFNTRPIPIARWQSRRLWNDPRAYAPSPLDSMTFFFGPTNFPRTRTRPFVWAFLLPKGVIYPKKLVKLYGA